MQQFEQAVYSALNMLDEKIQELLDKAVVSELSEAESCYLEDLRKERQQLDNELKD